MTELPDHHDDTASKADLNGTSLADSVESAVTGKPNLVDQVLDLDAFLSGEAPLPEKSASFLTRPDLEADCDVLEDELNSLVDSQGNPLQPGGDDLAGQARTAAVVLDELRTKRLELGASRRSVRFRAMPSTEWSAWRKAKKLDEGGPIRPEHFADLIVRCAIRPTFTPESLAQFRAKAGSAAWDALAAAALVVNRDSGEVLPKSPLASAVQAALKRSAN